MPQISTTLQWTQVNHAIQQHFVPGGNVQAMEAAALQRLQNNPAAAASNPNAVAIDYSVVHGSGIPIMKFTITSGANLDVTVAKAALR